MIVFRSDDPHT